eukprot:TRINITY_DN1057_c0_g4_i3.p1 TRINITY_DN1057_c0_g4~~TRINITY_DN1057_c0_g4_i3.p1  ORF type:complete len:439 (+),score=103.37 TRINITY_DN1057_c0_g4_i3:68-1318(+)
METQPGSGGSGDPNSPQRQVRDVAMRSPSPGRHRCGCVEGVEYCSESCVLRKRAHSPPALVLAPGDDDSAAGLPPPPRAPSPYHHVAARPQLPVRLPIKPLPLLPPPLPPLSALPPSLAPALPPAPVVVASSDAASTAPDTVWRGGAAPAPATPAEAVAAEDEDEIEDVPEVVREDATGVAEENMITTTITFVLYHREPETPRGVHISDLVMAIAASVEDALLVALDHEATAVLLNPAAVDLIASTRNSLALNAGTNVDLQQKQLSTALLSPDELVLEEEARREVEQLTHECNWIETFVPRRDREGAWATFSRLCAGDNTPAARHYSTGVLIAKRRNSQVAGLEAEYHEDTGVDSGVEIGLHAVVPVHWTNIALYDERGSFIVTLSLGNLQPVDAAEVEEQLQDIAEGLLPAFTNT